MQTIPVQPNLDFFSNKRCKIRQSAKVNPKSDFKAPRSVSVKWAGKAIKRGNDISQINIESRNNDRDSR